MDLLESSWQILPISLATTGNVTSLESSACWQNLHTRGTIVVERVSTNDNITIKGMSYSTQGLCEYVNICIRSAWQIMMKFVQQINWISSRLQNFS